MSRLINDSIYVYIYIISRESLVRNIVTIQLFIQEVKQDSSQKQPERKDPYTKTISEGEYTKTKISTQLMRFGLQQNYYLQYVTQITATFSSVSSSTSTTLLNNLYFDFKLCQCESQHQK